MDIRISLADEGRIAELESLSDWLRGEPELSGRVATAAPRPRTGELGALGDALVIAVGSGGALTALATSLRGWLTQPRRSDVRIRVTGEAGRTVEISADRVNSEDVEGLVRQALDGVVPGE